MDDRSSWVDKRDVGPRFDSFPKPSRSDDGRDKNTELDEKKGRRGRCAGARHFLHSLKSPKLTCNNNWTPVRGSQVVLRCYCPPQMVLPLRVQGHRLVYPPTLYNVATVEFELHTSSNSPVDKLQSRDDQMSAQGLVPNRSKSCAIRTLRQIYHR